MLPLLQMCYRCRLGHAEGQLGFGNLVVFPYGNGHYENIMDNDSLECWDKVLWLCEEED